jgi:DNA-binding NarL/FixJ family response regulator
VTGCLLKDHVLRRGETRINTMIANFLFSIRPPKQSNTAEGSSIGPPIADSLSPVQSEILYCLAKGMTNKAIARTLVLTSYNVDYHLKRLRRRFSVNNRTQLVSAAMSLFRN